MKLLRLLPILLLAFWSCKNETYEEYFRRNMTADTTFKSISIIADGVEVPTYSMNIGVGEYSYREREDSLLLKAFGEKIDNVVTMWDFDSLTKTDTCVVFHLAASSHINDEELYDTVSAEWAEYRESGNNAYIRLQTDSIPTFKRVKNLERTQTVKAEAKTAGCVYDSKGERIDFMIIGDQVYVHSQFMKVGSKMTEVHKLPAYIKYEVQYREIQ